MDHNQENLSKSLFEGQKVCLASIDHQWDAQIETRWTLDGNFQRLLGENILKPLSPAQLKKRYEEIEKENDEKGKGFYFTIRRLTEKKDQKQEQLLGFANLFNIEWSNGTGSLSLGIGDPGQRQKGYGQEALKLLLRYAFRELNLFRLSAQVPAYNMPALNLFRRANFKDEACQREVYHWAGKRWDGIYLGLLREEWEETR
jgi:RimJ/RimL family protein N-acetyltransferase